MNREVLRIALNGMISIHYRDMTVDQFFERAKLVLGDAGDWVTRTLANSDNQYEISKATVMNNRIQLAMTDLDSAIRILNIGIISQEPDAIDKGMQTLVNLVSQVSYLDGQLQLFKKEAAEIRRQHASLEDPSLKINIRVA